MYFIGNETWTRERCDIMVPMAKKKTHKKQSFRYAQPTQVTERSNGSQVPNTSAIRTPTTSITQSNSAVTANDNPFLSQDLARLGIIAVALIAVEFGLWFVFGHTSVGSAVYNLYKIQ